MKRADDGDRAVAGLPAHGVVPRAGATSCVGMLWSAEL